MTTTYRVYVDDPTNMATVHATGCSHWRGVERSATGYWTEPVASLAEALAAAAHTGKRKQHMAWCCAAQPRGSGRI
jgi:hypothetical protein